MRISAVMLMAGGQLNARTSMPSPMLGVATCVNKPFEAMLSHRNYWLAEERREHGEGGDGEIMLPAQPLGYLARTLAYGSGKL